MMNIVIKIILLVTAIMITYLLKDKSHYRYFRMSFGILTFMSIWHILKDILLLTNESIIVFTERFGQRAFGLLMTLDAFVILLLHLISSFLMIKFLKTLRKDKQKDLDLIQMTSKE